MNNDTESKILRAAEREFLTKGFAGARTNSIAESAGVTHAMLHYYFRTKEKLFDRIISEKADLLKETFLQSIDVDGLSLEVIIRNIVECHLDFLAANPLLPRFIMGELTSNPDRADVFVRKIKDNVATVTGRLQSVIDDAAAKGLCRRVDAAMLMLDIVSLNVFPYIYSPIVNVACNNRMVDASGFLKLRKKENFDTVMHKLNMIDNSNDAMI